MTVVFDHHYVPQICYMSPPLLYSQTQTQTQTKFIQQKQIQIPHHVNISFTHFTNNYDTWYIMNSRHVGRPPLESYLTAGTEVPEKEKYAWQWWKTQRNLKLTG